VLLTAIFESTLSDTGLPSHPQPGSHLKELCQFDSRYRTDFLREPFPLECLVRSKILRIGTHRFLIRSLIFQRDSNSVAQHGVLISHLAFTTTTLDLEILFAGCGDILDILIEKHPATGAGLGFGRVVFAGQEAEAAAKKAVETLHGKQMERGPLKVILDGNGSKFRKAKANVAARIEAAKAKAAESSHDRDIYTNDDDMEIDDASTPPPSNMLSPSSNLPSANSSTGSLPASATPANNTPNPQTSSTQPSTPGTPSTSKANQSSTSSGAPKRIPIPLPPNPRTRIPLPPIPPPQLHQVKGTKPTHKEDGEIDDNANKTKPSSITIPARTPLSTPRREWDKGLDSPHAPPQSLADGYRMPLKPSREIDPYRPSAAPPLLLSPGSLGRPDWMKQGGILPGPHSRDDFYDRRGSYFDDMQFPPERFERYPGRRRSSRSRSRSWSRSRSRERSPSPSWNLEGKMHGVVARRSRGLAERRNSGIEGEGTGWKRDLACLIINRDCLPFHRVSMENMKQEFDKFGPERVRTIICPIPIVFQDKVLNPCPLSNTRLDRLKDMEKIGISDSFPWPKQGNVMWFSIRSHC